MDILFSSCMIVLTIMAAIVIVTSVQHIGSPLEDYLVFLLGVLQAEVLILQGVPADNI